eukprot:201280-Chlamydomonas_euryale.AAC.1
MWTSLVPAAHAGSDASRRGEQGSWCKRTSVSEGAYQARSNSERRQGRDGSEAGADRAASEGNL